MFFSISLLPVAVLLASIVQALPLDISQLASSSSRTSAPSGSLYVAKSGGKYTTFQAAVNALSTSTTSDQTIFIGAGVYYEKVYIPSLKGKLYVYGYTKDTTSYGSNEVTISAKNSQLAGAANDDATATIRAWCSSCYFYNINMINTQGYAASDGQALALSASGDLQGYYGCAIKGYQDTLMFNSGRVAIGSSYIEGAVDFIFGKHGQAWIHGSDIRVSADGSTITASGRDSSSSDSWYVINRCSIAAASGYKNTGRTYLGRPWQAYARVNVQYTDISNVINSAGWQAWNPSDPRTGHVELNEAKNTGAGASGTRVSWAGTGSVAIETVLGSTWKNWVDSKYIS